ncbi:hypothetical protein [uncultured Novosphingobium sp.]|uniref:hypothetical protein n=1 Tax=uncultured Novosphingobium sp. TaxID=292277 RepID=UPI002587496B|nr:hypothetical protein [uncultured Novosphingobium sp.]
MANIGKGEVSLDLGDVGRFTLAFDMQALVAAEEAADRPIADLLDRAKRGFMGASRAIFFGALQRHHPETSIDDVDELLNVHGDTIAHALGKTLDASMPAADAAARAVEGKQGANPPGKSSGRSGAAQGSTPKRSGKPRRAASNSSSPPG